MTIRYFVRKDSDGTVSTVFKAEFDGSALVAQQYWDTATQSWESTQAVSDWYYMGDTDMDESTQQEVEDAIARWDSGLQSGTGSKSVRAVMGQLSRVKANRVDLKKKLAEEHAKGLKKYFDRQRLALGGTRKAAINTTAWNSELAGILRTYATATMQAVGTNVATELGGKFKPDNANDYVARSTKASAKRINDKTMEQLRKALADNPDLSLEDAVDDLYDGVVEARSNEISFTQVAIFAGLAAIMAANMAKATQKTWVVTSANPRPEHATMDGETVPIGETFSNGLMRPGEYSAGNAGEVANCTCDMRFN